MADTVTWSLLRELANFRAEKGCATSLYLNLDPSEVPTAGDAQAVAIFAAGLDNFWTTIALPEPVPDRFKVGHDFFLASLVPVVARADGTIVAVVGREQGHLYRLEAGRLREIGDHFDETPGQHDQGGWSQARYKRHIEKLVQEHLKGVAEELDRSRRRLHAPKIVL